MSGAPWEPILCATTIRHVSAQISPSRVWAMPSRCPSCHPRHHKHPSVHTVDLAGSLSHNFCALFSGAPPILAPAPECLGVPRTPNPPPPARGQPRSPLCRTWSGLHPPGAPPTRQRGAHHGAGPCGPCQLTSDTGIPSSCLHPVWGRKVSSRPQYSGHYVCFSSVWSGSEACLVNTLRSALWFGELHRLSPWN